MTDTTADVAQTAAGGEHARLARAGALIAVAGLLSRALGWARLIIIAAIFGASRELDAYFAAFRIPDAVFQLVAGGVLSSVLVPLIAQRSRNAPGAAWRAVSGVTNILLIALCVLALGAALAAPWLVPLIAPGFDEGQVAIGVDLTRIMLVSPICFTLGAVAASVLHSQGRFAATAVAPIVYNLVIVLAAVTLSARFGVLALAVGVAAGAVGYLLVQLVPLLSRTSYRHQVTAGLGQPGVGQAIALLAPRSLGLAGTQLIFIVNTALASTLGSGAVTAYTIAFTLLLIPVGLVGVPLGIVLFPSLARAAAAGSIAQFRRVLLYALRFTLWTSALLTALSLVLHAPMVQLLFGHGQLDEATLQAIAATTVVLFTGIGAHSINLVAARAFYARQDTRTPVVLTLLQVAITGTIAALTAGPLGLPGLGLAVAAGSWIKAIAMLLILSRDGALDGGAFLRATLGFVIGGMAAAAAAALAASIAGSWAAALPDLVRQAAMLLGGGAAGTFAYLLVTAALRLPEARRSLELARAVVRRR